MVVKKKKKKRQRRTHGRANVGGLSAPPPEASVRPCRNDTCGPPRCSIATYAPSTHTSAWVAPGCLRTTSSSASRATSSPWLSSYLVSHAFVNVKVSAKVCRMRFVTVNVSAKVCSVRFATVNVSAKVCRVR